MVLFREYEAETLERLQKTELEILKDFSDLCEKYDIDVGLTRKNYNKFMKVVKKEYADKYTIITAKSSKNFPLMNTRMALKGTKFKEDTFKNLDVDNGIFLDIFCFENVSDNNLKMKWQILNAWFWGKILILKYIKDPVLYVKGFTAKLVNFGCKVMHGLLKLFRVKKDTLYKKSKAFSMMYNDKETQRVAFMFEPSPFMSVLNLSDIEPTKFMDFNGMQIRFPNKIEVLLEKRYGDYMTLPPEEKRHNHPPYELEFPKEEK